MVLLKQSCCGLSLRAGSLIITYITLVQTIVTLIEILMGNRLSEYLSSEDYDRFRINRRSVLWFCLMIIIIVGHSLYGIYKKKHGNLIPFMILKTFAVFFLMIVLAFAPTTLSEELESELGSMDEKKKRNIVQVAIIAIIMSTGVEIYGLLILFSYYKTLRDAALRSATMLTPVALSATVADLEAADAFNPATNGELLKKMPPPPPYAV